jgi:hypothetical protein
VELAEKRSESELVENSTASKACERLDCCRLSGLLYLDPGETSMHAAGNMKSALTGVTSKYFDT